jgi:hypothetical protein
LRVKIEHNEKINLKAQLKRIELYNRVWVCIRLSERFFELIYPKYIFSFLLEY